ncbi:unnamed protein product [Polarella glacialis]|uniref:Uncharacterized protein n=1 Tax=Polarella glacialis TaxID=89957 RepID=A0A813I8X3_POLGL|nr:unnamed protein product [Polarella glacialis]
MSDKDLVKDFFALGDSPSEALLRRVFDSMDKDLDNTIDEGEFRQMCRMARHGNMKWWALHTSAMNLVMNCENAMAADDANKDLLSWSKSLRELGYSEMSEGLQKRRSHSDLWQLLATSGLASWKEHCERQVQESDEGEAGVHQLPALQRVAEIFNANNDHERLFLKIAFASQKKSPRDVTIFAQLVLLDFHYLVEIWQNLFPKRLSVSEDLLKKAGLESPEHYVVPPPGQQPMVCLSLAGWKRCLDLLRMGGSCQHFARAAAETGDHSNASDPSRFSAPSLGLGPPKAERMPAGSGDRTALTPTQALHKLATPQFGSQQQHQQQQQQQPANGLPILLGARGGAGEKFESLPLAPQSFIVDAAPPLRGTQDFQQIAAPLDRVTQPVMPPSVRISPHALQKTDEEWVEHVSRETPLSDPGFDHWDGFQGEDPLVLNRGLRHFQDGLLDDVSTIQEFEGEDIRWISASKMHSLASMWSDGEPVHVCATINPQMIKQGLVGNCWLIAAVSALAEFQGPIRDVFGRCKDTPLEGVDGPYELQLYSPFDGFQSRTVVKINDRIPCFRRKGGSWRPCFASAQHPDLWPMLLEKGLAKLMGGYSKLNGNRAPLAWAMITGEKQYQVFFPWSKPPGAVAVNAEDEKRDLWGEGNFSDLAENPTKYAISRTPKNVLSKERVWESLRLLDIDSHIMVCTFKPQTSGDGGRAFGRGSEHDAGQGLLAGHSYSLIAVKQVQEASPDRYARGRCQRLVQLRNPWGDCCEWTGDWSDGSSSWDRHPEVAKLLDYEQNRRRADGLFWMPWEEFTARVFDVIYSNVSFASKYNARMAAKADDPPVWSKQAPTQAAPGVAAATLTPRGFDLWQDLAARNPDSIQHDLSSWTDGFSDSALSLDVKAFPSTDIRWVSASRIHHLLKYEFNSSSSAGLPEYEIARRQRWADIAAESGGEGEANVCYQISSEVFQASLSDTWLAAAIKSLADLEGPIREVFAQCPKRPFAGRDGPYELKLFNPAQGFKRTTVAINDRVPCYARYGNQRDRAAGWRPCFSGAIYREMWPMLIEKAMAQLLGGYQLLAGNRAPLAWAMVTGEMRYGALFPWPKLEQSSKPGNGDSVASWGEGELNLASFQMRSNNRCCYRYEPRSRNERSADWVWDRLRFLAMDGRLTACIFKPQDEVVGQAFEELECEDGLLGDCAYSITCARSLHEPQLPGAGRRKSVRNTDLRLVQLRSPNGPAEWGGRWSPGSQEWEQHPKIAEELGEADGEDGLFWMCWDDFRERVVEIVFSEASFTHKASLSASGQGRPAPAERQADCQASPRSPDVPGEDLGVQHGAQQWPSSPSPPITPPTPPRELVKEMVTQDAPSFSASQAPPSGQSVPEVVTRVPEVVSQPGLPLQPQSQQTQQQPPTAHVRDSSFDVVTQGSFSSLAPATPSAHRLPSDSYHSCPSVSQGSPPPSRVAADPPSGPFNPPPDEAWQGVPQPVIPEPSAAISEPPCNSSFLVLLKLICCLLYVLLQEQHQQQQQQQQQQQR